MRRSMRNCFGCGRDNLTGLRLRFRRLPDGVVAGVRLGGAYESFPDVVHGGILATVLDECMGRAVYRVTGRPGVTMTLRVRFLAAVASGQRCTVRGRVDRTDGRIVVARAELEAADGALMATAEATFMLVSEQPADARADRRHDDRGAGLADRGEQ